MVVFPWAADDTSREILYSLDPTEVVLRGVALNITTII